MPVKAALPRVIEILKTALATGRHAGKAIVDIFSRTMRENIFISIEIFERRCVSASKENGIRIDSAGGGQGSDLPVMLAVSACEKSALPYWQPRFISHPSFAN